MPSPYILMLQNRTQTPIYRFLKWLPFWGQLFFIFGVGMKGRGAMDQETKDQSLKERIRTGRIRREDVTRRLA